MDNINSHQNIETILLRDVFYNKPLYLYIFKKVTKISTAIYIVTDTVKDAEPLKWSLRKSANDSVSFTSSIKDSEITGKEIISSLVTLKYFLEIAKLSNICGQMNCSIIIKEIDEIVEIFSKEIAQKNTLSSDFFFVNKLEALSDRNELKSYKGHNNVLYNNVSFKHNENQNGQNKWNQKVSSRESKNEVKGQRQEEILKIIKIKPNLTIKDITSVIKDCSEKTIQRELISMLTKGTIKKTGERRWSRYFVA